MSKTSIDLLIKNANELITVKEASRKPKIREAMEDLDIIEGGALAVKDGKIVAVGETKDVLSRVGRAKKVIDAKNKVVMPGFIDCHTHLLFGGSREDEFIEKIKGTPYLEILKKGGGILNTVEKTRKELTKPKNLINKTLKTLDRMLACGTTTAEVKTGYGLNKEAELGMLKVIKKLNKIHPMDLVPTFLGGHAIPKEYSDRREKYIDLVIEMLPEARNLAEYCDVFCETGAFSVEETRKILKIAKTLGMKLKLHTNEFTDIGGIELGLELEAVSLDHLDHICLDFEKIEKWLVERKPIGVLLPGVPFHLMTGHYAPAREMIKKGIPVALATDFNPGSCPTFSMPMIIALACRYMKMTPAEAINAATINAAHAIDRAEEIGSFEAGKKADVIILDIPNHKQLPYWFGTNFVETVIKNGRVIKN